VRRWKRSNLRRLACLALGVAMAAGCASQRTARKGEDAVRHQNWDAAVYYYLEALAEDPDNAEYRLHLIRARQRAAQEHFQRGVVFKELGRLEAARNEFVMAIQLDPTQEFAGQELREVEEDLRILSLPDGKHTLEEIKRQAREAKVKPPILDPTSDEPITLNFPKPKPVQEIYTAMGKAYGFNVLFDPKLKDRKLSIELNQVNAKQALEIVMQASGHFYKVIDEHTIIIADDTPQNRREYEDLVIKTFFLSNADVKDVDKLLRSLIEARRLSTNEQLNAITLRDTADKVAIAEKLITMNDKAKAEVMVDVELLEITASKLEEIGTKLSTQTFTLTPDPTKFTSDGSESVYLPDLANITRDAIGINVPSLVINLVKSSSEGTSLAQPQMRITEGEKGSLVIGDRIPIPITSFNTSNSIGSSVVPITSFQYQDVGIKIDVEPRVHHNREITLNVTVEVSQVAGTVEQSGQTQPIIGTRTINTVIRLQDGETNMLVGLYKEDTTIGRTELPLISRIPLLGRLFTNKKADRKTTDLVLTLTPHIIRFPDINEEDLAPVWVGTESRISFHGASPRVHSGRQPTGPFDRSQAGRDAKSRQRPVRGGPGVRQAPQQKKEAEQGTPGESLVPSSGPTSSSQSLGGTFGDSANEVLDAEDFALPDEPVAFGFEPSIVSIQPGQETMMQLVAAGGGGTFRVSLDLTFDSNRMMVEEVMVAPSVALLTSEIDVSDGWITLEMVLPDVGSAPQVVATLRVQGLEPGPVPMTLSADGAVDADGNWRTVSLQDGAVFVTGAMKPVEEHQDAWSQ